MVRAVCEAAGRKLAEESEAVCRAEVEPFCLDYNISKHYYYRKLMILVNKLVSKVLLVLGTVYYNCIRFAFIAHSCLYT